MVGTGGVAAVFQEVLAVFHLFGLSAREISFALLGDHIVYETALGLEVETHVFRLIVAAAVGKYRFSLKFSR